jgi:hypothetical protein
MRDKKNKLINITKDIMYYFWIKKDSAKMDESLNNGPIENRSCRDILCCLLFTAFLLGMAFVGIYGLVLGDPSIVLYPYDEDGRQCGTGNNTEYKYIYLYTAAQDLRTLDLTFTDNAFCVKTCPNDYTSPIDCLPTVKNPICGVSMKNRYLSEPCIFCF